MEAEAWSAVAAGLAALTTCLAVVLAWSSERNRRQGLDDALRREFQDDLYDKLFPQLVDKLGVDDDLDADMRKTLVPFFTLYSRVWANRDRFADEDYTWNGMKGDFEWWARHPIARRAWASMRRYEDTWAVGFVPYVDGLLATPGSVAGYPTSEDQGSDTPVPEAKTWSIEIAGPERLLDLEPLWRSLHEHHGALAPPDVGVRSVESSWSRQQARYAALFDREDAFLLLARDDEELVGYALVHVAPGLSIWTTSDRIAVIETMIVLPEHRHRGLGVDLLASAEAEAARWAATEVWASVLCTNQQARRFYERHGYTLFSNELRRDIGADRT